MNKIFFSIVTIVFCWGFYSCTSKTDGPIDLPNIILCMADDQGWGDMAYNGHPFIQTPNFDAMATEALRFDHFYAAAPVCSPTRGSILTGRHPNRFGCFTWGRTLRSQEITIAEALKGAGYVTGHFGKWHLGSVRKGSPVNPGNSGFDEWLSAPNYFDNNPILSREGIARQMVGESSMITVDAALEFILKHEGGKQPYFVVVWFGSPHAPHLAIDENRQIYEDQPENLQHFYGEITGMDQAIGKLRAAIKSMDTYENTILWYCSDNGGLPQVGTTGGRGHKGNIYEGGLRVPAILEWPSRIQQPGIINIPVNTCDILPTLLDIAGVPAIDQRPMDGMSLVDLLDKKVEKRTKPMGFWHYPAPGVRTPGAAWMSELLEAQKKGNMIVDSSYLRLDDIKINKRYSLDTLSGHAAWLDWPWKLHRIEDVSGTLSWELYQLDKDPMEREDLLEVEPERTLKMTQALEDWQRSVVRSLNGADY